MPFFKMIFSWWNSATWGTWLMTKLKGMTLAAEKQTLVDKAKTFYANYDFLDSYRLALAASQ